MSKQSFKTQLLPIFLHAGIWVFIFLFPLFFNQELKFRFYIINHFLPLSFTATIFYINFLNVVPALLANKKWTAFIFINALLIIISLFLLTYLYEFFKPNAHTLSDIVPNRLQGIFRRRPEPLSSRRYFFFLRHLPLFLLAIGVSYTVKNTQKLRDLEREKKEQENEYLKSKIRVLRYQVQPHFFFNTLNNIYSMVDTTPKLAKDGIHKLSKLMRYILYKGERETTYWPEEIEFIKSYISLMKLRYGKQLKIEEHYPETLKNVKIPPLLFIALIENSFKHGTHAVNNSAIFIEVFQNETTVGVKVINTLFPKTNDLSESGVGLKNLKERLEILYSKNKYSLVTEMRPSSFCAELIIPISN